MVSLNRDRLDTSAPVGPGRCRLRPSLRLRAADNPALSRPVRPLPISWSSPAVRSMERGFDTQPMYEQVGHVLQRTHL